MTTPKEDPEATRIGQEVSRIGQEWAQALDQLSEEDERILTLLRLMSQVVDPRYEMKGIRVLVGRALVDPAFRSRVLDDAETALAELRGHIELPENVQVRCVENSAEYLTIVLPPPSEALDQRSRTMRDLIFSRTSSDPTLKSAIGVDDNDVAPLFFPDFGTGDHDAFHFGDASHDG